MNREKTIKFFIDGIFNGEHYLWEADFFNEENCRKYFNQKGVEVIKIATKKNHHICKYCGQITDGEMENLLCDECREIFGHTFFNEL